MWSSRVWMRSNQVWMRSSRAWMRSSRVWIRSSQVIRVSVTANAEVATVLGSILRHNGIYGAADEAVLNKLLKKSNYIKSSFSVVWLRHLWCFREVQAGASPEEAPDRPGCLRGAHREEEPWRRFHQGSSRLEAFYQLFFLRYMMTPHTDFDRKIYFYHIIMWH